MEKFSVSNVLMHSLCQLTGVCATFRVFFMKLFVSTVVIKVLVYSIILAAEEWLAGFLIHKD